MSVVSIRFNDDEEEILKNYVKSKGVNLSQYIKNIIFEKIEEEYDLKSVQEYLKAKSEGTLNLIPFEEAIKEWDIE
ncbi:type II toxin-antitoxin system RelB family antitoxin [Fusobacterium polymorphum]|uniref:type II toxin-antitoxin system RelB family antitoxin n=1 Tax=Fusobacterium nucleatum subsp. polymorphum TaxID=76857 RepID=UPI00300A3EB0